jgi:hypothetical protein|tara:strand:+ start:1519 stop:1674 length:156 start_codon:yes stop_codon:yes gene_type:complete
VCWVSILAVNGIIDKWSNPREVFKTNGFGVVKLRLNVLRRGFNPEWSGDII